MTTAGHTPAALAASSPWLPVSPCTGGRCAAHPDPAPDPGPESARHGAALGVLRLAAGLTAALLGVLLAPLAAPLPATGRLLLVRVWCRTVLAAFGVRVRVTGRPAPGSGPLLVVANHVSWLDVPLLAAVLPGRMLAKREVRDWPVFGPLAALGGTLFVDRDRIRALPGTVGALGAVLAGGGRAVVFPEGTTWCGRAQGEFRPAVFQAARDTGTDVLPVRIVYTPAGRTAYVGADTLGTSLWRIARTRRLVAEIRVREPIPPARHPDRRALARAAHTAVTTEPGEPTEPGERANPAAPAVRNDGPARSPVPAQSAVASDRANLPASSVHQCASVSPAAASSARTPS
ncbi:lysophospholipid acyltransferase family protein [Streptomyces laurentii]|uniref:lysophospholipid acyltransferase family protein n=1 Tax=Streptomyces laurentii TaxID=39478 RepID=UPI0036B85E44